MGFSYVFVKLKESQEIPQYDKHMSIIIAWSIYLYLQGIKRFVELYHYYCYCNGSSKKPRVKCNHFLWSSQEMHNIYNMHTKKYKNVLLHTIHIKCSGNNNNKNLVSYGKVRRFSKEKTREEDETSPITLTFISIFVVTWFVHIIIQKEQEWLEKWNIINLALAHTK